MIGNRIDPFRGFNFSVTMTDSTSVLSLAFNVSGVPAAGSFSECSGLETTLEVEDYPRRRQQRPGPEISLTRHLGKHQASPRHCLE